MTNEEKRAEYIRRRTADLERYMQDSIKVKNPTEKDFFITWNLNQRFKVPAITRDDGYGKGCAVLPRFIAYNYYTQMADKIINDTVDTAVIVENEKRAKAKQEPMSTYLEQYNFEVRERAKLDRSQIIEGLFVEVVQEFGITQETPEEAPVLVRNTDDSIFERMEMNKMPAADLNEVLQP